MRSRRLGVAFGWICAGASLASLASAACGSSGGGGADPRIEAGADADLDATTPSPDGSDVDAGSDGESDGGDAAKDGTVALPFCTSLNPAPRFCDAFDDGDLTNDWTQFAKQPDSVFELDNAFSTSAPASFHVVAKAITAAASNNALLRSTMFGAVAHGKLAFSVLLPSVTFTKGSMALARFHVNLDDSYTLYLRGPDSAGNVPMLEEDVGGVVTQHMLAAPPPVGAWTRVTLDLDLAGGKATVSFDAQKALDAVAITPITGSEATVRLGAIVDGPADQLEAHFDDVVIDF